MLKNTLLCMEKEPILSNRENSFCASKRHTQDTQDKMRKEIFFAFFTESALFSCKGVYKYKYFNLKKKRKKIKKTVNVQI